MPFFYRFFTKKWLLSHPYFYKIRLFSKKDSALESMLCQKNVHFSQKHSGLMSFFFKFFMKKTPLSRPYLVKKRQFRKNYTIIWAQKVRRMPFFPIFHWKVNSLLPIFWEKNVHYLKTNCSHAHIWSKKRQFSKKKQCSHNIFFKFFMKNPQSCQTHIWSKKLSILSKLHYIMGQKSQEDAIFSDLSRKITSLMPIFCKKKHVNFLKNTLISCPYFVEKTSKISKTQYSHVIFFRFVIKKPKLSCPYLVKKASILSKINYIMG